MLKGASALSRFSITCNHDDDAGLNVGDDDGEDDARISGFTWEQTVHPTFIPSSKGPSARAHACLKFGLFEGSSLQIAKDFFVRYFSFW